MNKYIAPSIATFIIITYGLLFHYLNVDSHNWGLAVVWSLIYVLPVWLIYLFVELVNYRKEKNEYQPNKK